MRVKVPPRGVKKAIRVLGIYGDTVAKLTRKVRLRLYRQSAPRRRDACSRRPAQDVPVCGGGYIHVMDDVVLPYKL